MSDELASAVIYPVVERAWLSVYAFPDEKYPSLIRLRVELEINGKPFQDIVNTLLDPIPGNGIICQSSNLTWMLNKAPSRQVDGGEGL